jgi:hypothetical protein
MINVNNDKRKKEVNENILNDIKGNIFLQEVNNEIISNNDTNKQEEKIWIKNDPENPDNNSKEDIKDKTYNIFKMIA